MKVIGIFRGVTKEKNKPFTILHLVGEFEDYQLESAEGNMATSEYIPGYINCEVGDDVELIYGKGFQGKAVVKGVQLLSEVGE